MIYRFVAVLTLSILALSCDAKPFADRTESISPETPLGENFDLRECGNLHIKIDWTGDRPSVPPLDEVSLSPQKGWVRRTVPNPHAPRIDASGAVERAVVFLRKVDPARSKPWTIPEPNIILRETGFELLQPEATSVAFIRRGSEIEIATESKELQSVRARGAAFFTLMFPPNVSPLRRKFSHDGFVELSNATGLFATRAHLLVLSHPYYGTTNEKGLLEIDRIPEGDYELVCWMPNFHVERIERDPESGIQVRQFYTPPLQKTIPVHIDRNHTTPVKLTLSLADFGSPQSEKPQP